MKKIFKSIIVFMLLIVVFPLEINANKTGTGKLSASSTTVQVGSTIKITATISGNNMYTVLGNVSSSDNSILSGGGQIYKRDANGFPSHSQTFTFTAKKTGTVTISLVVDSDNTIDLDANTYNVATKTITIKVVEKSSGGSGGSTTPTVTKSSDNNLKTLTVSEGTLSPAFSPDVTEYTLNLEATVSKINVQATTNHSKASVSGTGDIEVSVGENTIKITVKAENGNPKVYKINAIVDEKPLVYIDFKDNELGVVRNLTKVPTLDGFEETTVKINDQEINAWYSQERNITVLYLQDGENKDFYIYDETNGIISKYTPLNVFGKQLAYIDIPEDLQTKNGFTYQEVQLNDFKLMGWVFNDETFKNYSLMYLMDENGEFNYYQYESTQNSLQLFSNAAPITQDAFDSELKKKDEQIENMTMYFYIACGICVILFILVVYSLFMINRYKKRLFEKANREKQ